MSDVIQRPNPSISVESISEADLNEARLGSSGNPTYEDQFGTTAAPLGTVGVPQPTLAELEFQAKMAEARALNPMAFGSMGEPATQSNGQLDYQAELDKFKQLYGQSENEKGALRKSQQELMEAFNGLMAQYEALQTTAQPAQWGAQMAPTQPQFGPQGYGQQAYFDPFEGIGDDDVIQGKQVKGLFEKTLAPAVAASWQQSQQAMQRMALLEKQLLTQAKAASGISPMDEYRLMNKNPWLKSLPEPNRLQALSSLKQSEAVQAQPTQAIPQQAETQQRIVNKVTYIEGSVPQTADNSQAALEAAKQRDYALALSKPAETGERARALRAFAGKYGLNFGQNPSDLAR